MCYTELDKLLLFVQNAEKNFGSILVLFVFPVAYAQISLAALV